MLLLARLEQLAPSPLETQAASLPPRLGVLARLFEKLWRSDHVFSEIAAERAFHLLPEKSRAHLAEEKSSRAASSRLLPTASLAPSPNLPPLAEEIDEMEMVPLIRRAADRVRAAETSGPPFLFCFGPRLIMFLS